MSALGRRKNPEAESFCSRSPDKNHRVRSRKVRLTDDNEDDAENEEDQVAKARDAVKEGIEMSRLRGCEYVNEREDEVD
jgi:hypothetical protein